VVGDDDEAGERTQSNVFVLLQLEMERDWVHARLRLHVIAAILALIAMLVAFGHARADAGDLTATPGPLGETLVGYPIAIVILVVAVRVQRQAGLYRRTW
jgi:hypothetical protein